MKNILVTGASGNVGSAIVRHLSIADPIKVWKASYKQELQSDELYFDFDNLSRTANSLNSLDILFLLRPPHISNTRKYFEPLIAACVQMKVKHIVFLSVQGAEKSSIIPHNRIEKIIVRSGIPYTFIRPSYFMQNLTTTLKQDIQAKGLIFLPAGKAKFLWVDVNDIGAAIAAVLLNSDKHINKTYVITGSEHFTFQEIAAMLTNSLQKEIRYVSPNLLRFLMTNLKEGKPLAYILVLILLHFTARFEEMPAVSDHFHLLTGKAPNTVHNFISENRRAWL